MRRLMVGLAVALLALAASAPAFAWEPRPVTWWQPVPEFTCVGKVKAVDTVNDRLMVRVHLASRGVQRYLGEDLVVTITKDTQLLKARRATFTRISLDRIAVGDHVRVRGVIDRSIPGTPLYKAERVVMRHIVPVDQLTWFACRGPVRAVDAGAGTMLVKLRRVTRALGDQLGGELLCRVAPDARIVTWQGAVPLALGLADIAVNDVVTAQGTIDRTDPTTPVYTIRWMRVWQTTPTPTPAPAMETPTTP